MSTRVRSRCRDAIVATTFAVAASGPAAAGLDAATPQVAEDVEPVVVGVTVNATLVADGQLVHRSTLPGTPRVWLRETAATSWRLDVRGRERRTFQGLPHAAFCDGRERCLYDESTALLAISAKAGDFMTLEIAPSGPGRIATSPTGAGAYLNYDVSVWRYGRPGASGLVDGHVFSPFGHGALGIGTVIAGGRPTRTLGQTFWQVDQPEQGRSWQGGSIVVPDTALGTGLPLTGLRVGSNPQLDPRSSRVLRPVLEGRVDRPVRTEVFVDGLFRQSAQVAYGPYSLELPPQLSGRGDVEVLTTDAAGSQTRIVIPYYQAPTMLQPGAAEWSLDAGRPAADGTSRGEVGARPFVASGSWRQGLTRSLTGQGQVLVSRHATRVAAGADTVDARWGASTFGLVWQRSPAVPGGRTWFAAGHEFASREVSASLRGERRTGGCTGSVSFEAWTDRLARPCWHGATVFGASFGPRWSASGAIDLQRDADARRTALVVMTARRQLTGTSQIALSLQQLRVEGRGSFGVQISWTRSLGDGYALQTGASKRSEAGATLPWSVQQVPSLEPQAAGPRLQAGGELAGPRSTVEARWSDDAERIAWRSEARLDRRGASGAAGVTGALGLADGRLFGSRRIDDAFVLVDVGLPGLPVLLDNREVARTGRDGWAVVSGARARQDNNIGVDTTQLPTPYVLPRDQQNVVPGIASGAVARFELSDGGIAIPVRDALGRKLAPGAAARVSTQSLPTAVTSRSEIFVDRSDRSATIIVETADGPCELRYDPADTREGETRCVAR